MSGKVWVLRKRYSDEYVCHGTVKTRMLVKQRKIWDRSETMTDISLEKEDEVIEEIIERQQRNASYPRW